MKYGKEIGLVLLAGALVLPGCGDDDESPTTSASGASGGSAGSTAGSGGSGNGGSGGAAAGGSGGAATGGTGGAATGGTGGAVGGSGGATGGAGGSGAGPAGKANPPTPGAQIDRAGRSVITGALIETFNADTNVRDSARDAYNSNADSSTWSASHKAQIKVSLGILDSLDGVCGNQLVADQTAGDRYDFLADVLVDDQLYVLTSEGTCGVYLGLEADIVGVPNIPANCGGRMPADDVINRSYSVLANGSLGDVDDTIAVDDKPASATFPFLSAP